MTRTLALAGVLVLAAAAAAADPWQDRTRSGELAYAAGDLARAERELAAALAIAQALPPGSPRLEASLDNLARLYDNRGRLDDAQPLYQLLLAAQEERLGEGHPALLDTLAALARVTLASGDVPTADASLRRYVELADATGTADDEQLTRVLLLLARTAVLGEHGEEALAFQRRAVAVMTASDRLPDLDMAVAMTTLAGLEIEHGDPAAAAALLVEAARRRAAAGEPPALAAELAEAAAVAAAAGHHDVARQLATQALADPTATPAAAAAAWTVVADAAWARFPLSTAALPEVVGIAAGATYTAEAVNDLAAAVPALAALPDATAACTRAEERLVRAQVMVGDLDAAAAAQRDVQARHGVDVGNQATLVELLVAAGRDPEAATANAALVELLAARDGATAASLVAPLERQLQLLTELGERKAAKAVKKRLRELSKALGR